MSFLTMILLQLAGILSMIAGFIWIIRQALVSIRHRREQAWAWCARCTQCQDGFRIYHGTVWNGAVCQKCGHIAFTPTSGRRKPDQTWEWKNT